MTADRVSGDGNSSYLMIATDIGVAYKVPMELEAAGMMAIVAEDPLGQEGHDPLQTKVKRLEKQEDSCPAQLY